MKKNFLFKKKRLITYNQTFSYFSETCFPKNISHLKKILKNEFKNKKLSANYSIMPEYQFFHNLSNQGIMSLEDYNKIFKLTKLKLKKKILFDNISLNGKSSPSAAIFFLS